MTNQAKNFPANNKLPYFVASDSTIIFSFNHMALKTFVKISGVNNLSDARYCAGMLVDVIGFTLDKNDPTYIGTEKFTEITEWLSGVSIAAEFTTSNADEIRAALQDVAVDYIQVNNTALLAELLDLQVPLMLHIDVDQEKSLTGIQQKMAETAQYVKYFVIEGENRSHLSSLQKDLLSLTATYPILLGFEITENNVHRLIDTTDIKGIALKGGEEIKPGLKDFDELADILESIEIDDVS